MTQRVTNHRRLAIIWLVMSLFCMLAALLLWLFNDQPEKVDYITNEPVAASVAQIENSTFSVTNIDLHELDADVAPIDFENVIRDLRSYPEEFKDRRYLIKHKGSWTVQVMNVAENTIITDYLDTRSDRSEFAYFRIHDENNQSRYMLIYGIASSPQEALGMARQTDFGLPSNVRVLPEEISRYLSVIDNYERGENLLPVNGDIHEVDLRPTTREIPVATQSPVVEEEVIEVLDESIQPPLEDDEQGLISEPVPDEIPVDDLSNEDARENTEQEAIEDSANDFEIDEEKSKLPATAEEAEQIKQTAPPTNNNPPTTRPKDENEVVDGIAEIIEQANLEN